VAPKHADQSISWLFFSLRRDQQLPAEQTLPSPAVFTQICSPAVNIAVG